MALADTIAQRQARRAVRVNRDRQALAEKRSDELTLIVDAGKLLDTYDEIDAQGDRRFIAAARAHYATLTTHEQQETWAIAMAEWLRDENSEERLIRLAHDHNAVHETVHHANTPAFTGELPASLIARQRNRA